MKTFLAQRQIQRLKETKVSSKFEFQRSKQESNVSLLTYPLAMNTDNVDPKDLRSFWSDNSEQNHVQTILQQMEDFCFNEDNSEKELNREYVIKLLYQDDFIYTGQVLKGTEIKDGRGILKWPDYSKFMGHFDNDKAYGQGRLVLANGDVYEGEWKPIPEDVKISIFDQFKPIWAHFDGFGDFIQSNGSHYAGEWKDGKKNGYGKEFWPDGTLYLGYFEKDSIHGGGILTKPCGEVYNGNFENGIREGDGRWVWPDGKIYEGTWKNNVMEGLGILILPDGRKYEGELKNNVMDGFGELILPDKTKYIGNWKNGKQNGKGTLIDIKGNKLEGFWEDGVRIENNVQRSFKGLEINTQFI